MELSNGTNSNYFTCERPEPRPTPPPQNDPFRQRETHGAPPPPVVRPNQPKPTEKK